VKWITLSLSDVSDAPAYCKPQIRFIYPEISILVSRTMPVYIKRVCRTARCNPHQAWSDVSEEFATGMLTEEELESQVRQNGVEDIKEVKHARLEPDGHISVIRYSREDHPVPQ
jgi:YetF C-terminal domain